jgi:hypothetical protein
MEFSIWWPFKIKGLWHGLWFRREGWQIIVGRCEAFGGPG